jgi:phosphopantothenoylcysteine decarboxylase/phosphopantothenate--cysteine ligase
LRLQQNQDILKVLGQKKKHQLLVGFAAETKELEKSATRKLVDKNLDIIAGNLVGTSDSGFASDTNNVTLFFKDGTREQLPTMEKLEVAHILLDRIVAKMLNSTAAPQTTKDA